MVRSQALSIAGLARAGGVGVETVRFYQRRGLLMVPPRGDGIRRYDAEDIRRLRFIRTAQVAGFTLAQIAELIELDASEERDRARALARERIAALNVRIDELITARKALERLADECARGGTEPCPILAAFDAGETCGPAIRP